MVENAWTQFTGIEFLRASAVWQNMDGRFPWGTVTNKYTYVNSTLSISLTRVQLLQLCTSRNNQSGSKKREIESNSEIRIAVGGQALPWYVAPLECRW